MKKALGAIPAVFPMPVLMVAAYDENGKVNVMNAAWGMISDMNQITLFLSEDHKTTANILATKAFTVALADKDHMDVADFFWHSDRKYDEGQVQEDRLHSSEERVCECADHRGVPDRDGVRAGAGD